MGEKERSRILLLGGGLLCFWVGMGVGCRLDLEGRRRRRYLSSGGWGIVVEMGMGMIGFERGRVDMEVGKRMARKEKERYRCPYYC